MSSPDAARARRVLVAVVLAGVAPPGGHVYVGRPARGFALLAASVATGILCVLVAPRSLGLAQATALPALLLLLAVIADAGWLARATPAPRPNPRLHRWWVYVGLALVTQLAVPDALWRLWRHHAGVLKQPDAAMEPVVLEGEGVVFRRRAAAAPAGARDELVVVRDAAGAPRIRRIAGLPGETVAVRRGEVLVDGATWVEDWMRRRRRPDLDLDAVRVPADHVLVLGDRRRAGDPVQGPVAVERIAGRPTWIWSPPGFPFDLQLGHRLGERVR